MHKEIARKKKKGFHVILKNKVTCGINIKLEIVKEKLLERKLSVCNSRYVITWSKYKKCDVMEKVGGKERV